MVAFDDDMTLFSAQICAYVPISEDLAMPTNLHGIYTMPETK